MTHTPPDEQHHFIGWSIERFGDRCFLERHGADFYPAPSVRVEIAQTDFRALLDQQVSPDRLLRKHNHQALTRGLENPSVVVKLFLAASFVLVAGAFMALMAGWV